MTCSKYFTQLNIFMLGAVLCWTQGLDSCLQPPVDMNPEACCNCTSQPVSLHCYGSCPNGTFESVTPTTSCGVSRTTQTTTTTTLAAAATTGVSVVTCLPCYSTCSSCTGGGEDNCTACAPGYQYQDSQTTSGHLRCVLSESEESTDGLLVVILVVAFTALVILLVFCYCCINFYREGDPFCAVCFVSLFIPCFGVEHCRQEGCREGCHATWYVCCTDYGLCTSRCHRFFGRSRCHPRCRCKAYCCAKNCFKTCTENCCANKQTSTPPQRSRKVDLKCDSSSAKPVDFQDPPESAYDVRTYTLSTPTYRVFTFPIDDSWTFKIEENCLTQDTLRKDSASVTEKDRQRPHVCAAGDVTAGNIKEVAFSCDVIERFGNNHLLHRHVSSEAAPSIPCHAEFVDTYIREEEMSRAFSRIAHDETGNGPVEDQPRTFSRASAHRSSCLLSVREISDFDDDFLCPCTLNPERDNSSPGCDSLQEIKAERTSTYVLNQHNSATHIKSEGPNVCSAWQFSGNFSRSGGVLQGERSDVRLVVPEGTLQKDTILTIKGAVSTDLEAVHKKLQLPQYEYIASPVAEYISENESVFQKPVWIILPHFLSPCVTADRVCVYCARRDQDGQLHIEKMQAKAEDSNTENNGALTKSGSFFFDENNNIRILTYHFSAYFCTYCGKEIVIPDLWIELYAKHIETNGSERHVDVRLEIWDRRVNTRDFREDHPDAESLSFRNMQRVDGMELPALTGEFDPAKVAIGARLVLSPEQEAVWMHRIRPDENGLIYPVETTIALTRVQPWNCLSSMPKRINWGLTNRPGCVPFRPFGCIADVGYTETESASPFIFLRKSEHITFDFIIELSATSQQIPDVNGTDRDRPLKRPNEGAKTVNAFGSRILKRFPSDADSALGSEAVTVERSASPSEGAVGGFPRRGPCSIQFHHHNTIINPSYVQTTNTSYNNNARIGQTGKVDFKLPREDRREQQAQQGPEYDHQPRTLNNHHRHHTLGPYEHVDHHENLHLPPHRNHANGHRDDTAHIDREMRHVDSFDQYAWQGFRLPHTNYSLGQDLQNSTLSGRDQERLQSHPFTRRGHHVEDRAVAEPSAASRLPGSENPNIDLPFPCHVSSEHEEPGTLV